MPYLGKQPSRTAFDTSGIPDDSITAAKIVDGAITIADIADDAVTADKLANSINTEIAANTAKVTNATHSGEVTGATALTIVDDVVDEANLKVSNTPTNGYFLSAQSGNTGGLTWAEVDTTIANDSIDSQHYAAASIDNEHLADNAVDTAEIADNAVTLAKMAGGTDGNLISYDASGNPVAIATGSDGQVLTSTGAGSPPAFENVAASGATNIDGLTDGFLNSTCGSLGMGYNVFSNIGSGANHNVAYGIEAHKKLTTGDCNTAIGYRAGYNITTGSANTYVGWKAGRRTTDGTNNVAIGAYAYGYHNAAYQNDETTWTGGNGNIAIGNYTAYGINSGSICLTTNIGDWANKSGTNQSCLAGTDVYIENAAYSDCRAKCDIQTSQLGLNFVNALNPVSYKWIPNPDRPLADADGNIHYATSGSDENGDDIFLLDDAGNKIPILEPGFKAGAKRTHYGLIAQEVKTVLDDMGIDASDFAGYIDQKHTRPDWTPTYGEGGETATKALRYEQFISPIIKAIQELSDRMDALENA